MSEEKTDKGRLQGASASPGRTAPTQGGSSGSGVRSTPPDPKGNGGGTPPPRSGSALAGIALGVALLVAAGAAGGGYWLWQQDRRLQAQHSQYVVAGSVQADLQPIQERLSALSSELQQLAQRPTGPSEQLLARLDKSVNELEQRQSRVQQQLARQQQADTELQQNAQRLKQRFDELARAKRAAWAESEAGYLAFVAKNRIRFYGDVDSALAALKKADELLADLGGESIEARRGIARAVDSLLKIQPPDRTKINQALYQIGERLPELPLAVGTATDEPPASAPASPAAAEGWRAQVGHAWEELKGSLSRLVVVARDLKVVPLVTPQERFFLHQNLTLELEAARLAALRGDQALYQKSLERAREWLGLYFDEQSAEVEDTISELGELAKKPVAVELPDIGPLLAPVERLGFRSAQ
ncbi:MAG: uroporphyrinogen-III C-methyltransferase [Nitrococcus mobilis]|nr:uroporphyrinogen-III C-methyltransferase [Nitrococcus mobilis]